MNAFTIQTRRKYLHVLKIGNSKGLVDFVMTFYLIVGAHIFLEK